MKIGIFDSGLGGLAILREIVKILPDYDYIFLADNARVPYGGRSKDLIFSFTQEAVEYLFKKGCAIVILACNAATASALRRLQRDYLPLSYPDRRILGVIRPAIERVVELNAKRVGVIGTYATIESESFMEEIKKLDPKIKVFQQACPLLVPIIEEGEEYTKGMEFILDKYLRNLTRHKIDTLILGCTHYELIENYIKKYLKKGTYVISEGKVTAQKFKKYLLKHPDLNSRLTRNGTHVYLVTDINPRYAKLAKKYAGSQFKNRQRLELIKLGTH